LGRAGTGAARRRQGERDGPFSGSGRSQRQNLLFLDTTKSAEYENLSISIAKSSRDFL